jgi:hypothetical protein
MYNAGKVDSRDVRVYLPAVSFCQETVASSIMLGTERPKTPVQRHRQAQAIKHARITTTAPACTPQMTLRNAMYVSSMARNYGTACYISHVAAAL